MLEKRSKSAIRRPCRHGNARTSAPKRNYNFRAIPGRSREGTLLPGIISGLFARDGDRGKLRFLA